ncbi:unnamed protein product, partial [Mesorhabditis belari]|uniref:Uncharacterized protein n=1 Tax=Mesorhabditis belari TaxID=2138241 RepID=A0AAF3F1T6_9BILA
MNQVCLVAPRPFDERLIVSARETDRIRSDDLMALAQQVSQARDLVKNRACDRLQAIAEQMEFLHMKAKQVLDEAARDEKLHQIPCNVQKIPGKLYHLYKKQDETRYFSILSPNEWNSEEKRQEYIGSFRYELDRSWTPLEKASKRDDQFHQFRTLLEKGQLKHLALE